MPRPGVYHRLQKEGKESLTEWSKRTFAKAVAMAEKFE
jgi:hypothetical protein